MILIHKHTEMYQPYCTDCITSFDALCEMVQQLDTPDVRPNLCTLRTRLVVLYCSILSDLFLFVALKRIFFHEKMREKINKKTPSISTCV